MIITSSSITSPFSPWITTSAGYIRSPLALVHLFQLLDQVGNIAVDRIRHDAPFVPVHLGKQLPHDCHTLQDAERFDHAVTQGGIVPDELPLLAVNDGGVAHGFASTWS